MSNKPEKKKKQNRKNVDTTPSLKSPAKTLWGKIVIIVIVCAMALIPVVGLIFALIDLLKPN